jgi:hypothetical protein
MSLTVPPTTYRGSPYAALTCTRASNSSFEQSRGIDMLVAEGPNSIYPFLNLSKMVLYIPSKFGETTFGFWPENVLVYHISASDKLLYNTPIFHV